MSLDTYLPVGRGRYAIGSEPQSPGKLFYFSPERRDHLRIGFEIVRQDDYGDVRYSDVVVYTPDEKPVTAEEGEYSIQALRKGCRLIEFRSAGGVKKLLALGQPGLGRFRFISAD